ncbi:WD-repeat protein [Kalymmatonema gypsitolerans NIES-4073]|nr:WD-repeat protein [Scytonema sp. NIES-4073]
MVEKKNAAAFRQETDAVGWQCIHTFPAHTSWVYGVAITPDGQTLASVCSKEILIWDLETGHLDKVLCEHSSIILSLAISPDGQTIASGSLDKTVKLWNLQTGELNSTLSLRADPIHCVAFSPDGKILASGGENKYKSAEGKTTTIYLWNPDTGELMGMLSGHSLRINHLAFSPDGRILASTSNDQTIKIWDLETRQLLHTLIKHKTCSSVAITPDGKILISSGFGIKFWDLTTGELLNTLREYSDFVRSFSISPDGQTLVGAFHDDTYNGIKVWNLGTGEVIHTLELLHTISVAFSPNGKMLAAGSATCYEDGAALVKVWEVPFNLLAQSSQSLYESELGSVEKSVEAEGYFNPEDIEDARNRINTSIVRRQGQPQFRRSLLKAYNSQCVITRCDAEQALEAAHIIPYLGPDTNHPSNGLLLRADIHTLFDLHLLSLNPETMTVVIAPKLVNTCYGELFGQRLQPPKDEVFKPSRKAIEEHYKAFLQKQNSYEV